MCWRRPARVAIASRHGDDAQPSCEDWGDLLLQGGACGRPDRQRGGSLRSGAELPGAIKAPMLIRRHRPMCSQAPCGRHRGRRARPAGRRSSRGGQRQGSSPRSSGKTASPLSGSAPQASARPNPPWLAHGPSPKRRLPPLGGTTWAGVWGESAGGAGRAQEAVASRDRAPTPGGGTRDVRCSTPGERAAWCALDPEARPSRHQPAGPGIAFLPRRAALGVILAVATSPRSWRPVRQPRPQSGAGRSGALGGFRDPSSEDQLPRPGCTPGLDCAPLLLGREPPLHRPRAWAGWRGARRLAAAAGPPAQASQDGGWPQPRFCHWERFARWPATTTAPLH